MARRETTFKLKRSMPLKAPQAPRAALVLLLPCGHPVKSTWHGGEQPHPNNTGDAPPPAREGAMNDTTGRSRRPQRHPAAGWFQPREKMKVFEPSARAAQRVKARAAPTDDRVPVRFLLWRDTLRLKGMDEHAPPPICLDVGTIGGRHLGGRRRAVILWVSVAVWTAVRVLAELRDQGDQLWDSADGGTTEWNRQICGVATTRAPHLGQVTQQLTVALRRVL